MLVLSRKASERIVIGDNVTIVINKISGSRVTIGIEAPDDVRIVRGELEPVVDSFAESKAETIALPMAAFVDPSPTTYVPRAAR